MGIFFRNDFVIIPGVICSREAEKRIKKYVCKNKRQSSKVFVDYFSRKILLKIPAQIKSMTGIANGIFWTTSDAIFRLYFVDNSIQVISEDNEIRVYSFTWKNDIPFFSCVKHWFTKNDRTLETIYNLETIRKEVYESKCQFNFEFDADGQKVNEEKINEYLMNFNMSRDLQTVFDEVMGILEIIPEKCNLILIKMEAENGVGGDILFSMGKLLRFAYGDSKKMYHLFKNGDWKYMDSKVQIKFKDSEVTMKVKAQNPIGLSKLYKKKEKRVSKLFEHLNSKFEFCE